MKCPRCGLWVTDAVPRCVGCDFSIDDLDRALGAAPPRSGRVVDEAGLLDEAQRAELERRLEALGAEVGGEIVVVTRGHTRPVTPEQYAFWLCNRWQLGGEARAGLLLLVASAERRVECEVGYGWEGVLGEDASGRILDEHVVPAIRAGRLHGGLLAGLEALAGVLREASPAAAAEVAS